MKSFFTTLLLLLLAEFSYGQYTEVINSRRPGFSDTPYSVGTKVYQVEAGLFYKNVGNYLYYDPLLEESFSYSGSSFGSDIMLRTGQFFERLEFSLDMAVVSENRDFTLPDNYSESAFGFSKLTLGAKYLVYKPEYADKSKEIRSWKARHSFDKRRLIPAVGVYAGLNTNLLTKLHKNPEGISPRFGIYTQNDLSNRLIVLFNFIADKVFTEEAENTYIMTVTYTLHENWSVFAENQGFFRKNVPNDFQFGAGGAYLINPNMQADFSARMIFDERGDNTYLIGGGLSWRLDKHKDKIIVGKVDNDENIMPQEKKSFFNTITFGLFAGKKSSNSGKMRQVKTSKVKTRDLQAPVNKKAQKARKKQNQRLVKEQKQKEKAQKKHNKKSENN
ncbi:transporter [Lutimonas sp.]|jgi:hypothetical protein|uniref:transporter n=1 Tax=Lutimonas sp. TaxID=1872403 RepID=UPI003C7208EB